MSKMNVGQVARALILKYEEAGKSISNDDLALKVVELFKNAEVEVKTTGGCIAWYKNDMRKKGLLIGKSAKKAVEIDLNSIEL